MIQDREAPQSTRGHDEVKLLEGQGELFKSPRVVGLNAEIGRAQKGASSTKDEANVGLPHLVEVLVQDSQQSSFGPKHLHASSQRKASSGSNDGIVARGIFPQGS